MSAKCFALILSRIYGIIYLNSDRERINSVSFQQKKRFFVSAVFNQPLGDGEVHFKNLTFPFLSKIYCNSFYSLP